MTSPKLSIIIVSFNTKDVTRNCLQTIYASKTNIPYEVILVDNDSHDGSIEMVRKEFPQVKAIASGENGGFAKANNLGATQASGEYVWLLNSDTLLEKDTIEVLMEKTAKKGAVVASCCLLNADGTIQPQGGALPTLTNVALWMLNLDSAPLIKNYFKPYQNKDMKSYKVDRLAGWLGGTALLVRRDLYASLGGLDDHIFMYGEDVDFCYRVHQGFLPIHYFAHPKLTHLGQASGSSERAILGEFSGLKYVWKKHFPAWQYPIVRLLLKVGALLRTCMFALTGDAKRRAIYAKAITLA